MIFNSLPFAVFFVIFFFLYWLAGKKSLSLQNYFLLGSSYFFYCWFNWRFSVLLAGVTVLTYYAALKIQNGEEKERKLWLRLGIWVPVLILVYFKYTNFFIQNLQYLFAGSSLAESFILLKIVLPLGISFYIFRAMGYVLEVNNGKQKACTQPLIYANFISFFPSLISGPIDRARLLLPQLNQPRTFTVNKGALALRQILWGLFKKIVIADSLSVATGEIFAQYAQTSPDMLWLGAFFFSIQLYADFSGYSDLAIGIARLMGFEITKNFDFPYFSVSIVEFWRKWHISLTGWLTDFIFTPVSVQLRDAGKWALIAGIMATFTVSGFWHGANWTFVCWGILNGLYYIPSILNGTLLSRKKKAPVSRLKEYSLMAATFILVCLTNVFFNSVSVSDAPSYLSRLLLFNQYHLPLMYKSLWPLIALFIAIEWNQRQQDFGFKTFAQNWPLPLRWLLFACLIALVFVYNSKAQQFIYFQF